MKCPKCGSEEIEEVDLYFRCEHISVYVYHCLECDFEFFVPKLRVIEEMEEKIFKLKFKKFVSRLRSNTELCVKCRRAYDGGCPYRVHLLTECKFFTPLDDKKKLGVKVLQNIDKEENNG